jgi:hypothetical protein
MALHSSHSILNGAWIENIPFLPLTLTAMSKSVHNSQWVGVIQQTENDHVTQQNPVQWSFKVTFLNNKILQTDMNIDKSKIVHPQTYQV